MALRVIRGCPSLQRSARRVGVWGRPTDDPELESEEERAALEEEIRAQGPCGFRRNGSRKDHQGHEHCRKVQERRVGH